MNNYLMELNRKKEEEIWKVNKSGFLFLIKFGEFSTRRKLYRNPARRENLGTGSDRKKVVPESGTQRGNGDRQRSEESCTGIRYAERKRGQAAIGRKLYRNPVRQVGAENRQRSEESCTGIRYVR